MNNASPGPTAQPPPTSPPPPPLPHTQQPQLRASLNGEVMSRPFRPRYSCQERLLISIQSPGPQTPPSSPTPTPRTPAPSAPPPTPSGVQRGEGQSIMHSYMNNRMITTYLGRYNQDPF